MSNPSLTETEMKQNDFRDWKSYLKERYFPISTEPNGNRVKLMGAHWLNWLTLNAYTTRYIMCLPLVFFSYIISCFIPRVITIFCSDVCGWHISHPCQLYFLLQSNFGFSGEGQSEGRSSPTNDRPPVPIREGN